MAKVLSLDVTLRFGESVCSIGSLSPQEAFNLLHMPSMGEHVVCLVPIWSQDDGLPSMPVTENKE